MSARRTARRTVRAVAWLGWAACVLGSYLWGASGRPGLSVLWTLMGFAYLWIIVGMPTPRALAVELLRAITGRRHDAARVAELERELEPQRHHRGR